MGKLTVDECKRIISEGWRRLTEAQERIAELERILDLDKFEIIRLTNEVLKRDELIRDMWAGIVREHPQGGFPDMGLMEKRMRELGIGGDGE